MTISGKDPRTSHIDSVYLILILFFGILVFPGPDFNRSGHSSHTDQNELSVLKSGGTILPLIRLDNLQQIWILNKDNFRLLSFDKIQFTDNKKTTQGICVLDRIRNESGPFQIFYLRSHPLLTERDEIPVLS